MRGRCVSHSQFTLAHKELLEQVPGIRVDLHGHRAYVPWGVMGWVRECMKLWGLAWHELSETVLPVWDRARVAKAIVAAPGLATWLATGRGGPFGLAQFQLDAVAAMLNGAAFLEEPAGAGKTVQGVVWAALEAPKGLTVVVTKSAVTRQFAREITRFTGDKALLLSSPSKLPVRNKVRVTPSAWVSAYLEGQKAAGQKPWIVLSWASLRSSASALLEQDVASVILDESQLGKNPKRRAYLTGPPDWDWEWLSTQSAWSERLSRHCSGAGGKVVAMTATPVFDRRSDLWGQLTNVDPGCWGETATKFFHRYCGATPGEYGGLDVSGATNTQELKRRLERLMYRVPKFITHAELPQARISFVPVTPELQDKPAAGFGREMKRLAKMAAGGDGGARGQLMELQLAEAATRKRSEVLLRVGEALARGEDEDEPSKGKVVVFAGRYRDCAGLADRVERKFKRVEVFRGVEVAEVNGKQVYQPLSGDDRQRVVDAYMAHPGPCVAVAMGKSWGTGIDLQDTDYAAIVALPWTPGELSQWIGRFRRLGMTRTVDVELFVAEGTADERMQVALMAKLPDIRNFSLDTDLIEASEVMLGMDRFDEIVDEVSATLLRSMRSVSVEPPKEEG